MHTPKIRSRKSKYFFVEAAAAAGGIASYELPGIYTFRSSRPEVFCKKSVTKNFAKLTGKCLRRSFYFMKWSVPVNFVKF